MYTPAYADDGGTGKPTAVTHRAASAERLAVRGATHDEPDERTFSRLLGGLQRRLARPARGTRKKWGALKRPFSASLRKASGAIYPEWRRSFVSFFQDRVPLPVAPPSLLLQDYGDACSARAANSLVRIEVRRQIGAPL
jgi:hypothetical protein